MKTYENADEIVNVKAAIKAFEDGVLGNHLDQWTVFYNGRIVDRINSHRELLWSVRQPLYQEIYGKVGSIWIEPVCSTYRKFLGMAIANHTLLANKRYRQSLRHSLERVTCLWCTLVYSTECMPTLVRRGVRQRHGFPP